MGVRKMKNAEFKSLTFDELIALGKEDVLFFEREEVGDQEFIVHVVTKTGKYYLGISAHLMSDCTGVFSEGCGQNTATFANMFNVEIKDI